MRQKLLAIAAALFHCLLSPETHAQAPTSEVWPPAAVRVDILSSADGSLQPAMFYVPPGPGPAPLLVGLHTWGGWYGDDFPGPDLAGECINRDWAFIYPHFRGPNNNPAATGSPLAVQDIVDAVGYAKQYANIDPTRIYLVGVSGGGHAGLLAAGQHPDLFTAVSVWVPISDLTAWHHQTDGRYYFADQLEASTGGRPGDSPAIDEQYRLRSPLTYLSPNLRLTIDINAGIMDGHTSVVPVSHSLLAFNALARPEDRIPAEQIAAITEQAAVPIELSFLEYDPDYGAKQPLFRRSSNGARVTIFNGGHEIIYEAALGWLEQQRRPLAVNLPVVWH